MPRGKMTPESARRMYEKKYGPEEGFQKWQEAGWADKTEMPEADFPMPDDPGELKPQRTGERGPKRETATVKARKQATIGLATVLTAADRGAHIALPRIWIEEDLADPAEIGAIAKAAIEDPWLGPKLLEWMLKAERGSAHLNLVKAVGLWAYPRVARRGMLPSFFDGSGNQAQPERADAEQSAVPMDGGPAYGDHRDDGLGQVSPDSEIAGLAPLFSGAQEQGGFSPLYRGEVGPDGGGDARPAGEPLSPSAAV